MATETETKKETTQDPHVASMLKALGYLDDPAEQAKLPADRAAEETETKVEETEAETKVEATASTEEAKPDETTAETKEEVSEEAKTEEKVEEKKDEPKVEDKTAKKVVKQVVEKKPAPTLDEIADTVKGIMADAKKAETTQLQSEPKKEDSFRKSLHPAELKALELAETAEKMLGDKYKNAAEREIEWIRKHREAATANAQRNEGKFDPNDEDYLQFVRANRPVIPQHDREEIFMLQAEERATVRIKKEMKAEIEQRDRAIAELKFTPVIERVGEAVKADVLSAAGEEFTKAFNDTPDKVAEDFPLEAPIVTGAMHEASVLASEYLHLAKQIKPFDKADPTHNKIIEFISHQGKELDSLRAQGKPFVREGKTVISRDKFYTMVDQNKDTSGFTTFDDNDVIKMITFAVKASIEDKLKKERQRVDAIRVSTEKRAAAKTAATTEEKKTDKKDEKPAAAPPKGGSTPSKGAKSGPSTTKTIPAHMKALGYDMVPTGSE